MLKRIADIIGARLSRRAGEPYLPALMTWNVTDRCNAHCVMCEIHGRRTSRDDEIPPARFASTLGDPALRNLQLVRLTGGEPFLRRDLPDIVSAIAGRKSVKIIYITTNGSFPGRLEDVAAAAEGGGARLQIQVSLDALDATHDELRGAPGMGEKAKETCSRIAALKKRFDFDGAVNQTVLRGTLDHIESVHRYADGLGLGHHIFLGAEFHEGKDMRDADPLATRLTFRPEGGMNEKDIERFYQLHSLLKKAGHDTERRGESGGSLLRDISEEYLNEGGRNRALRDRAAPNPPCMAMFTHFRLAADGGVYACSALKNFSAGNIKDTSFSGIWHGEEAAELRRRVLACRGCWIECDINPSIFFSGDIIPWFVRRAAADAAFRRAYLKRIRL